MTLLARPGTALLVAALNSEGTVEINRYPVAGWIVLSGYLTPLTVVPPRAMPPGRHAIYEPENDVCSETIIDLTSYAIFNSEDEWSERVSPGLAVGESPVVFADTLPSLQSGPGIRDNAPDQQDPDRPKRSRRTKAEMEQARAAEAKRIEEARAQTDTTATLTESATVAPVLEDEMI